MRSSIERVDNILFSRGAFFSFYIKWFFLYSPWIKDEGFSPTFLRMIEKVFIVLSLSLVAFLVLLFKCLWEKCYCSLVVHVQRKWLEFESELNLFWAIKSWLWPLLAMGNFCTCCNSGIMYKYPLWKRLYGKFKT